MKYLKNILIIFFFISIYVSLNSKNNSKDVVFKWWNSNNKWHIIDSTYESFHPTDQDIKNAKQLSNSYIEALSEINNNVKLLPFPNRAYYRQYVGFIDENGDKIIFMNAFWDFNIRTNNKTNCIFIMNEGTCYYQIKVNLNEKKCFDFDLNGIR